MHPYLAEIEKAINQIYQALDFYNQLLDDLEPPVMVATISEGQNLDSLTNQWIQDNSEKIRENIEKERKCFSHVSSKYILCGSLLQIAYMGIKLYGSQHQIPEQFLDVKPKTKESKKVFERFCYGREIRCVPIGLVVYAGRNQYNHYDSTKLSPANSKVFDMLSRKHGLPHCEKIIDPSFDLSNKSLQIYTSNIIAIMKWQNNMIFFEDINHLLNEVV